MYFINPNLCVIISPPGEKCGLEIVSPVRPGAIHFNPLSSMLETAPAESVLAAQQVPAYAAW